MIWFLIYYFLCVLIMKDFIIGYDGLIELETKEDYWYLLGFAFIILPFTLGETIVEYLTNKEE